MIDPAPGAAVCARAALRVNLCRVRLSEQVRRSCGPAVE